MVSLQLLILQEIADKWGHNCGCKTPKSLMLLPKSWLRTVFLNFDYILWNVLVQFIYSLPLSINLDVSFLNLGKIATKYLLPELAGSQLTPKLCDRVAEAFVTKYGKYAGWAQTLLFIAELPSQKALLPSHLLTIKQRNPANAQTDDSGEEVGKKSYFSLSILTF